MDTPLVSVLLPVYNGSEFVERAIDSVLSQTFTDLELIIVDDGSTDNTKAIIESINDSRIRLFPISHQGIAKSLNVGLAQSKGRYIARMDADDICNPKRLEKQIGYLEKYRNVGAVACTVKYNGLHHSLANGYKNYVDWTNTLLESVDIANNRFVESPLAHPSIVFRKSLIQLYGNYSTDNIPEDYELWLRWIDQGVTIAKIDEELLTWNDHSKRLSRVDVHYAEEAFYNVKAKYFKKWFLKEGRKRKIFIWGKGNVMRRRLRPFDEQGITIAGFIDINQNPDANSIYFKNITEYKNDIVLGFVADKNGKAEISAFLEKYGLSPGIDFFHMV